VVGLLSVVLLLLVMVVVLLLATMLTMLQSGWLGAVFLVWGHLGVDVG